jgi:hypothetical protein
MSVRPFDWRDLPALYRFRQESVFLDNALLLTRGPLILPGALLSYLAPAVGMSTLVSSCHQKGRHTLIGQIMGGNGDHCARLTFLTPQSALETAALPQLLEALVVGSAAFGAHRLVAEVDEYTPAFDALRFSSFSIYARQRIWRMNFAESESPNGSGWRVASSFDQIALRSFYNNVVPGLVQQVEPFTNHPARGLVLRDGSELLAYVELKYGYRGIWVNPFFHPDVQQPAALLQDLMFSLPFRRGRPVYICVRTYQSWLEPALEDLGAEAGPRQAVIAKHLVIPQKAVRVFALPALTIC